MEETKSLYNMAKKNSVPIRIKGEDYEYLEEEQRYLEKCLGIKPTMPELLSGIIRERKGKGKKKAEDLNYFDI